MWSFCAMHVPTSFQIVRRTARKIHRMGRKGGQAWRDAVWARTFPPVQKGHLTFFFFFSPELWIMQLPVFTCTGNLNHLALLLTDISDQPWNSDALREFFIFWQEWKWLKESEVPQVEGSNLCQTPQAAESLEAWHHQTRIPFPGSKPLLLAGFWDMRKMQLAL